MVFKFLRKYVKIFLWAMAILIIPSFILWGVGSGVRSHRQAQEAGRIFRHRVTWSEYEAAARAVEMFLSLSNLQIYAQFFNPLELAWDRLILLHEAKRRRIMVPNEAVVAYIRTIPAFRTKSSEDGKDTFEMKRYESILHRAFRTTPRAFEEEIRKTLVIAKLREQVTAEVSLDEETLRDEYKKRHDQRKVSYVAWYSQDFEGEVTPTSEELAAYFTTHQRSFQRSEEIRVAFVSADFEKQSKEQAEALIGEVLDELLENTSKDLEEIAKTHHLSFQETGFFTFDDPLPASGSSYELSQEAFRLEVGQISDPIETASGITILKLLEKRPPRPLTLEEAHAQVEKAYRAEKGERLCRKNAEEILATLQKKRGEENLTWEEAVKTSGLSLMESPFFTREGSIEKIGNAPEFSHAAFAFPLQGTSGVVTIPNGFAILHVEGEEPFSEEAFVKERENFRETVLKQKQSNHYMEWFKTLRSNAELVSHVEAPPPPQVPEFPEE